MDKCARLVYGLKRGGQGKTSEMSREKPELMSKTNEISEMDEMNEMSKRDEHTGWDEHVRWDK